MEKFFLIVAFTILSAGIKAQTIKDFAQPESINSDGKYFYITNIGTNPDPAAADGDGYISKVDCNGKIIVKSITTEKLNAPKGTAVLNNILYTADLERIVGIDLRTGKKVKEISLAKYHTVFTNDLTVKNSTTLFVSATDTGAIFEVNLKTGRATEIVNLKGVNGIFYDTKKNQLFVCSFIFENPNAGQIGVVKWKKNKAVYERIGNFSGAFDGLWLLDENTLLVSNWAALDHAAGFLEKINLKKNTAVKLELPLVYGPADFFVDVKQKSIIIPIVLEGKIVIAKY
ncbi:hypothetical protein C8C83_4895 [Flavobacterium sp. 90]|uniref:YncE family protein n=1 Tax=unclassified Flavobacterium TaxID=196869 RepID=UPI000EADBD8B|nr:MULTISPECIES: hypothetical protein [unclassified Flavobacterium]RKR05542.1 hypothetical protein C8C82_5237 [Flavobacterium sp. 81]TCK56857.1 hypothetical protein C8C83_4895 [Flavobacterium sp. 90]